MKINDTYTCKLIGNLVTIYLKGQLSELDLYNSIIRLVYTTDSREREKLKPIIEWLDQIDSPQAAQEAMKDMEKVKEKVGEDYVEGILRIASSTN